MTPLQARIERLARDQTAAQSRYLAEPERRHINAIYDRWGGRSGYVPPGTVNHRGARLSLSYYVIWEDLLAGRLERRR